MSPFLFFTSFSFSLAISFNFRSSRRPSHSTPPSSSSPNPLRQAALDFKASQLNLNGRSSERGCPLSGRAAFSVNPLRRRQTMGSRECGGGTGTEGTAHCSHPLNKVHRPACALLIKDYEFYYDTRCTAA